MIKPVQYLTILVLIFSTTKSVAQLKLVPKYYKYIHLAELAVINSNYKKAFARYTVAFIYKNEPFSQDILNALIVSVVVKKTFIAKRYFKILQVRGYNMNVLRMNKYCKRFLKKNINENSRLIKINNYYRQKLDSMYFQDQKFRLNRDSFIAYKTSIIEIEASNLNTFDSLYKFYGFPTENKVGNNSESVVTNCYDFIFYHIRPNHNSEKYLAIVKDAIYKGDLNNRTGGKFIEFLTGDNPYCEFGLVKGILKSNLKTKIVIDSLKSIGIKPETEWGYLVPEKYKIRQLNTNRQVIFMEPLEDYLNKIIFSHHHPDLMIIGSGNESILEFENVEQFLKLKKNLKYIN